MNRQDTFKIETVYETLIESAWFLTFVRHNDNSVTIIQYERDHMRITKDMGKGRPVENKQRMIVQIKLGEDEFLDVRNPSHVFSYK